MRGRHLRFEYIHSETGHIADSVDLKIGRSAVRSCNALDTESRGYDAAENESAAKEKPSSQGANPIELENLAGEPLEAPIPLGSSNTVQMQVITVQ